MASLTDRAHREENEMDRELKEALEAVQLLRAFLWLAYDGGGKLGEAKHPVEVTRVLDETEALLKRHGMPDGVNEA
jgi:hypothetical protein